MFYGFRDNNDIQIDKIQLFSQVGATNKTVH